MPLKPDPLWYKDALIYEVHVRAFYDSVTDGIGDFGGLTQKLDYLEDLGVTAIWLLPFCPSPLRDDGYDISSYTDVHPSYGNLKEVQRFLREAHRRGLRVITELVLNHTSDQHVWFQRSRRAAPGSRWRNFYVWSDTPDRYRDARIIFKDFETSNWTWDPVAKAYYWHRFYSHQPDLNWDNPEVKEAMFAAVDFWFDMGVDGLRLDAVPYLFEREGTNCENLPETHEALRELRSHVESKYRDRMLLAEANQWPEESVAYFGQGDECHMAFHFPVMPRMFMSLRMEDRYPMTDILRLTPSIPANCQWAMFLRNHDELTLEMVTDEERDYMYRTYAHDRQMRINLGIRRRLAPLLENDRRKIELMNALLFSMPGTPVVYYGDEIGMGDNVYLGDRNGVRTPMQWSADRNAGFSRANPQKLYLPVNIDPEYHYEAINVETQQNNPHSLLWWMKRLIAQRKQFRAFGRGSLEFLYPTNRKVLAFVRQYDDESILVIANLSRFAQSAELELGKFEGHVPVEVFGRSNFPAITSNPYLLSLGPHAFYWFHLQPSEATQEGTGITAGGQVVPVIEVDDLEEVFEERGVREISRLLPRLLRARAWFLGKRNTIRSAQISSTVPITGTSAHLTFVDVEYSDSDPETYLIPLSVAAGERAESILRERGDSVVARLRHAGSDDAVLYGGIYDRDFSEAMLRAILKRSKYKGGLGEVVASHTRDFREAWSKIRAGLEPQPRSVRLHTTINFGENFVLKLYRKIGPGTQPDRDIAEFLTQNEFTHTPRALGALEYRVVDADGQLQTTTLGLLTSFPRNASPGWDYMLHQLGLYFERALTLPEDDPQSREFPSGDPMSLIAQPVPPAMLDWLGTNVELIRQLGVRAAEMHTVLASRDDLPDFAPEPFTDFYRHGLYHGMVGQINRSLDALRARLHTLNAATRDEARALISREADIRATLQPLRDFRIGGSRIRHHGDFHLGHVLFTGNDALVTEFGGDPARPMSERRIKRTALRDIASMVRSFHYISHAVLYAQVPGIDATRKDHPLLEKWAQAWYQWASAIFLSAYMQTNNGAAFLPQTMEEVRNLLSACLIEKAMVEISYELENRPDWVRIPVHGVLEQLQRVETEVGR